MEEKRTRLPVKHQNDMIVLLYDWQPRLLTKISILSLILNDCSRYGRRDFERILEYGPVTDFVLKLSDGTK